MTRRDILALPWGLAFAEVGSARLLVRVGDGTIVHGDSVVARSWTLPPGSTCKPFTLQALLEAGRLRAGETFLCPGELRVGEHNLTCSHPRGLAPMDVAQVLAYSCNCATARFAQRFTTGELAGALRGYGFRVREGDIRLMALGEEGVLVTPLDLAKAYCRLGKSAAPVVREGLEGAVAFGTAQLAGVKGLHVAGKTGSVVTTGGLHAALFAGFAPSRSPEYVAVVVTQGQSGGADAAPLAAELFRQAAGNRVASSPENEYRVRFGERVMGLRVEDYVAAVLAGEASVFEQAEALKAMAVAARTYAANQKGRHSAEGYDFCNTTHCQRAEPGAVTARLTQAARATEGEVLRFHNLPAFTPYTMSCGGTTESGAAVWPEMSAPYLRTQHDEYCQPAVWTRDVALHDIERALEAAGMDFPKHLRSIWVLTRSESGRARQLRLEGDGSKELSAGTFRFAVGRELGWNTVRSSWFDVSGRANGMVEIRGKGEGHGVGLCQRGAEAMAKAGLGYRDILAFYYSSLSTNNWVRMGGEGVTVYATDPVRERKVLAEAERMAGQLPWRVEGQIEIYVHATTDEFRNATHEPGWVAARTEGKRIDLQPVRILEQRGAFATTLRHELLHVAVESRAVGGLPVWFREGLVEWLAGDHRTTGMGEPWEEGLRERSDEQQAALAYGEARAKVAKLMARYGEATVLGWVAQGLPEEVKNSTARTPVTKSR